MADLRPDLAVIAANVAPGAKVLALGHYQPAKVVTNADLADSGVDTSDQWIVERTGIKARRQVEGRTATSDLAEGLASARSSH